MIQKVLKSLVVILMVYASVMVLLGLQHLFDRGDLKKASKVFYQFRPGTSQVLLVDQMAQQMGVEPTALQCQAQILSRYEGHVLMVCTHDQSTEYQWVVDVVAGIIKPHNQQANVLFQQIKTNAPQPKPQVKEQGTEDS
ncbi:MAG: hypothetical protein H7A33_00580 [Deltaproteobacteria bacterium]|nr:hypothetical protein [Deltaproteobacteria bacterium]